MNQGPYSTFSKCHFIVFVAFFQTPELGLLTNSFIQTYYVQKVTENATKQNQWEGRGEGRGFGDVRNDSCNRGPLGLRLNIL